MRRREFIALLGGAAVAWPHAARAQQPAKIRIGIVTIQPRTSPIYAAFDQRLRELGYIEGKNLVVDFLNDVSRPHASGGGQGRPDAGNDKVRINSSSLDHSLAILADQALEIVAIAKITIRGRGLRWATGRNEIVTV